MGTSIITTTTFTFATIIDVSMPVISAAAPALETDDFEITECMLAAMPRCGLTATNHCGRKPVACRAKAK